MKFFSLSILLFIHMTIFAQEKKKGILGQLDGVLNSVVKELDKSGANKGIYGTLKGNWEAYSAGGTDNNFLSPRNHVYDLIFDREFEKVEIDATYQTKVKILNENEELVYSSARSKYSDKIKAGKYKMIIAADRDYSGKYEVSFHERVKSVTKLEYKHEILENLNFDD
jgi:hypothetical protein